jgi:hypothetical protein
MLALDRTDELPYEYWNQCLNFALQLHLRGALHRGDFFATYYDGGPTAFGLPVYVVSIDWVGGGHAINGILVGDDPLDFDDWLFVEPQLDLVVQPGSYWGFPLVSDAHIWAATRIDRGGATNETRVVFRVDAGGWSLIEHDPDLVLTRPAPPAAPPDNRIDFWNPRLVPGVDALLHERARDDASRVSGLYLRTPVSAPEENDPELSPVAKGRHLLDVFRDAAGTVHLLWMGKTDDVPGVFYGRLALGARKIVDRVRVSSGGARSVRMGRLVVLPGGEKHAFWLEEKSNASHPHATGIHWSTSSGGAWSASVLLSAEPSPQDFGLLDLSDWWERRDPYRAYFDVTTLAGGRILLAWNEPETPGGEELRLRLREYDDGWGAVRSLGLIGSGGVALGATADRLVLVYTKGTDRLANRGRLVDRVSEDGGATWSAPRVLDESGEACCPRAASSAGKLALVWDRREPAWSRWSGAGWTPPEVLDLPPGAEAWYPNLAWRGGALSAAWSERRPGWTSAGTGRPDPTSVGTARLVLFADGFESGDRLGWSAGSETSGEAQRQ